MLPHHPFLSSTFPPSLAPLSLPYWGRGSRDVPALLQPGTAIVPMLCLLLDWQITPRGIGEGGESCPLTLLLSHAEPNRNRTGAALAPAPHPLPHSQMRRGGQLQCWVHKGINGRRGDLLLRTEGREGVPRPGSWGGGGTGRGGQWIRRMELLPD